MEQIAIFLSLLLLSFSSSPALAHLRTGEYVGFSDSQLDWWVGGSYLSSTANFDATGGSFSVLPTGRYYKQYLLEFGSKFDVTDSSAFGATMGYANGESSDAFYIKTNGNLTNVTPFFETKLLNSWLELIGRFALVVPFEQVSNSTSNALIDEGVMQVQGELQLQKDFDPIFVTAMSGYYSLANRASRIPYSLFAGVELGSNVIAAGIQGFQSTKNDPDTNAPAARNAMLSRTDGGSTIYGAINPSVVMISAYYRFHSSGPWDIKVSGDYTGNGENYAQYWSAGLQFGYTIDFSKPKARYHRRLETPDTLDFPNEPSGANGGDFFDQKGPVRRRTPPPATFESEPKQNQFKVQPDDHVDQNLFKPRENLDDPYVEKEMKQQSDDSGFVIELTPKKKKKKKKKK